MAPPNKFLSLIPGMVGRRAWITCGVPTGATATADLLDEVADRWNCWRLRSETPKQHRHRVQIHLHTLAIAMEDDLALIDALDPATHSPESENPHAR